MWWIALILSWTLEVKSSTIGLLGTLAIGVLSVELNSQPEHVEAAANKIIYSYAYLKSISKDSTIVYGEYDFFIANLNGCHT